MEEVSGRLSFADPTFIEWQCAPYAFQVPTEAFAEPFLNYSIPV